MIIPLIKVDIYHGCTQGLYTTFDSYTSGTVDSYVDDNLKTVLYNVLSSNYRTPLTMIVHGKTILGDSCELSITELNKMLIKMLINRLL